VQNGGLNSTGKNK